MVTDPVSRGKSYWYPVFVEDSAKHHKTLSHWGKLRVDAIFERKGRFSFVL